jgi:hypothetical protein
MAVALQESMRIALQNYLDADGHPICPECGLPLEPGQPAARPDGCMVHLECFDAAMAKLEPCQPSQ